MINKNSVLQFSICEKVVEVEMKVRDSVECARPIYFENVNDDYPYSFGGTCFLVKYEQTIYAITARHVLANGFFEAHQARIPPSLHNPVDEFVSLDLLVTNGVYEKTNKSKQYADIAIYRIPQERILPQYELKQYELTKADCENLSFNVGRLLTRGYPCEILGGTQIDHDKKLLTPKSLTITGSYLREAFSEMCHLFQFDSLPASVKDPDGMSGSPVFQIIQVKKDISVGRLCGIFIAGYKDTPRTGCFIDVAILFQMFEKNRLGG